MRYRQVHLDFHTSEWIRDIGRKFDKEDFQKKLQLGHVNSITLTAKCAHGWGYYNGVKTPRHPYLDFDLLQEMIDAAHEINVKTPVYLSVGLDEKNARNHPEWLIRGKDERTTWVSSLQEAGWHRFCLNNPYQEIVLEQIREVVENYDLDGLFLDVSSMIPCSCQSCVKTMIARGQNPLDVKNVWALSEEVFLNFTKKVKMLVESIKPELPVFHNGGHIQRGFRELVSGDTHLELESLPTGGWGYDHLPMSALYAKNLGMEYLGMTGKFHTQWGEFGGFKHPNGLRYEMSQCLAYGAKCSIGDQMHPNGTLDYATYELIGKAYGEVEQKEVYLKEMELMSDIAILSLEAIGSSRGQRNLVAHAEKETLGEEYFNENLLSQASRSDVGALRLLRECNFLFDIIDTDMEFNRYKVILIPDYGIIDEPLEEKLVAYMKQGGKLYLSGTSGKRADTDEFIDGIPLIYKGVSEYQPVYVHTEFKLQNFENSSFIVYGTAHKVEMEEGAEIKQEGEFLAPYFNRTLLHFCSHLHAPCSEEFYSQAIFQNEQLVYIAFNLFEEYKKDGSFIVKDIFRETMNGLLKDDRSLYTDLPSEGVVTLMKSKTEACYINHLLYATPVHRGEDIEIIEDIVPLYDIHVELKIPEPVDKVVCIPQMKEIPFTQQDGVVCYTVPEMECHQMVQLTCRMKETA